MVMIRSRRASNLSPKVDVSSGQKVDWNDDEKDDWIFKTPANVVETAEDGTEECKDNHLTNDCWFVNRP